MGILARKITTFVKNIVDLSDHPNDDGLSAADLKAFFDGRTDAEIKTSINGLIDDLLATTDGASGADQIGATAITGGVAVTAQGILEELNTLKAADSAVVHKTGNETVAGVKTFSSSPIVPTPTTDMQASTKKYVDDTAEAKINTSAIVNGLAETNAGKVLDAMQGKALADLISTNTLKINEKTSYGVYTGLVVAQQTVADMTVKCSAGTIYMANFDRFAIDAVASIAVTAADGTNPRIDIIYVSSLGAVTYLAGTAAASPSAPATPAGGQKIAEINVTAGATSIVAANIIDKRKFLWTEAWQTPTLVNGWSIQSGKRAVYRKNQDGIVYFALQLVAGTVTAYTVVFTIPVGYRSLSSPIVVAIDELGAKQYIFVAVSSGDFIIGYGQNLTPGANYYIFGSYMAEQ